jgi:hypothetical protein
MHFLGPLAACLQYQCLIPCRTPGYGLNPMGNTLAAEQANPLPEKNNMVENRKEGFQTIVHGLIPVLFPRDGIPDSPSPPVS